ncbi:MAG: hypothetical protein ACK4S4_11705 [Pyrinomonadaceae bacterium]
MRGPFDPLCSIRRAGAWAAALLAVLCLAGGARQAAAQRGGPTVDRSVATVQDGVRTEVITYSDILWQLALEPGAPVDDPPQDDVDRALQTLINQRLFALEAERVPQAAPTDQEIADKIADIVRRFASPAEFERRLKRVGFSSVRDDNFERIVAERVAIEKYIDFRFRSFIVITPADEEKYYREVYVPEFRRRFQGVVVPSISEKRSDIRRGLTEDRVAEQIETFLDEAKRRAEVVILTEN